MAITKQKKEEILAELVDKFGRSQSVVFADYRGLDVASISDLRTKCREGGAEMKVAKKTLIKLAAKDTAEIDDSVMEGPVVATFSYEDPLSGIQILYKYAKANDNLKLLGGIIDGKVIGADEVTQYAKLPSREELLAKVMGSINSPVSGFVGMGNALVGGLVRVLNAYKDTKPAEEAPAPAAEEPKAEAPAEESKEEPKEEAKEEAPAEEASAEAPAEEPQGDAGDDGATGDDDGDDDSKDEEAKADEAPADTPQDEPTDDSEAAKDESTDEPTDEAGDAPDGEEKPEEAA